MTQKKRNKYFFKEKEIYRLKAKDAELNDAIRNQGWIELEKPVHNGYYAEWVLREDISRRDDVAVFQEALDACKEKIWSRNPEFKYKNRKTKKWEVAKPKLKTIHKEQYEKLSLSARKLFVESTKTAKYWRYGYTDKEYRCTLSYELVVYITKAYITHRREHDNVLYQMDAENEKMLYQAANGHPWTGGSSYPKWWRKHELKKEKLKEERKVIDVVKGYKGIKSKKDLLDL